jgi:hypothetical protein
MYLDSKGRISHELYEKIRVTDEREEKSREIKKNLGIYIYIYIYI